MQQYNARTEAQIINQVFKKHDAQFRIDPTLQWRVTPAFTLFKLEMKPHENIGILGKLRNNIEHAIHAYRYRTELIGDTDRTFVRINLQPLALEVNLPKPNALPWSTVKPHLCGVHYGIKGDTPLVWNPDEQPHALVAGTTGSGKTNLLISMIASACMCASPLDLQFIFVDFKNSQSLRWLAKLPHVQGMVTEPDEAIETLQQFYDEILRRKQTGPGVRQVLVIDELASFTDSYEHSYKQRATHLLHEIARLGREYKMHLIACTQKPTAKIIGEQLKANLPLRLIGMVTSPEESKCATGIAQAGAHLLPGKGAFIYVHSGLVRRFQVPWIDDLMKVVRKIRFDCEEKYGTLDRQNEHWVSIRKSSIPPCLISVFNEYGNNDGTFKYKGLAKAMQALHGDGAPTGGENYIAEANRIKGWLKEWSGTTSESTSQTTSHERNSTPEKRSSDFGKVIKFPKRGAA